MAGLRKAAAYSKRKSKPYTRTSKRQSKSYIKTVPQQNIVKFRMGDVSGYDKGKYKNIIELTSGERILIRDNALEASRQFVNKQLERSLAGEYYFEVKLFPHHILRENKALTGAGADRMSSGMQRSFGKTMGRAAIVKKNQAIFLVAIFHEKSRSLVNKILNQVKAKLPCHTRLVFEKKK
tara:strand:- start:330 stop:869 length:540 start_codon:yes stop_codon:yes gene_type:complete